MKKILYLIIGAFLIVTACEDLQVENFNDPDFQKALNNADDLVKLLKGSTQDCFDGTTGLYGVHIQMQADQLTTTNKYLNFWDFAEEPRLMIPNNTTYGGRNVMWSPWSNLNSALNAAFMIIRAIEIDGKQMMIDDVDRTDDVLAGAHFAVGFAQGFLGVYFDQGYVVDLNTDPTNVELSPYTDLVNSGLDHIETAIQIATSASADFHWDFMHSTDFDKDMFIKMCNSFRAKIAMETPRTAAEQPPVPYTTISTWVDNGFTDDFTIATPGGGEWAVNMIDWAVYRLSSGAGYIPSDQKIFHLINPNQYQEYYHQDTMYYSPVITADQRIYGDNGNKPYYWYIQNFGYLRGDRNRYIFSVHSNNRWWNDNNNWTAGVINPIMLKTEMALYKAEIALKNNDIAGVLAVINDPNLPRKADGMLPDATAANAAEALDLIRYEWAVELDLAAMATGQWAFMRRWDLLQEGTMTELPIPARERESTGDEPYSFGGVINAGQPGTAAGPGWRTVANGQ